MENHGNLMYQNVKSALGSQFSTFKVIKNPPEAMHNINIDSNPYNPPIISKEDKYKKEVKPMLERKRRARINVSLDALRNMITLAYQKEGKALPKLEKADIMELTVQYVQSLVSKTGSANPIDEDSYAKFFKSGYYNCAQEVSKFVMAEQEMNNNEISGVSAKVLSHLSSCITRLDATPASYIVSMAQACQKQQNEVNVATSYITNQMTQAAQSQQNQTYLLSYDTTNNSFSTPTIVKNEISVPSTATSDGKANFQELGQGAVIDGTDANSVSSTSTNDLVAINHISTNVNINNVQSEFSISPTFLSSSTSNASMATFVPPTLYTADSNMMTYSTTNFNSNYGGYISSVNNVG